jgi:hypothetical protein
LEFAPGNGIPATFATGLFGPKDLAFAPTPEPSSFLLALTGAAGILLLTRYRRSRTEGLLGK